MVVESRPHSTPSMIAVLPRDKSFLCRFFLSLRYNFFHVFLVGLRAGLLGCLRVDNLAPFYEKLIHRPARSAPQKIRLCHSRVVDVEDRSTCCKLKRQKNWLEYMLKRWIFTIHRLKVVILYFFEGSLILPLRVSNAFHSL